MTHIANSVCKMIRQEIGKPRTRIDYILTIVSELNLAELPLRIVARISTRFEGWIYSATGSRGTALVLALDKTGNAGWLFSGDGRRAWHIDCLRFIGVAQTAPAKTEQIHVRVADLQPDDYLPATQRTVIGLSQDRRTPRGYIEVALRNRIGKEYFSVWREATLVWIVRPEVANA